MVPEPFGVLYRNDWIVQRFSVSDESKKKCCVWENLSWNFV
jgi:hypothetical protein